MMLLMMEKWNGLARIAIQKLKHLNLKIPSGRSFSSHAKV
jgi:hypothetical protein